MRRKRLVDEDLIGGANKRQAVEADQGAPAPSTSPDTSAALEGQANGHPVSDGIAAAVDDSAAGTNEAIIGQSKVSAYFGNRRTWGSHLLSRLAAIRRVTARFLLIPKDRFVDGVRND